jgi:chaperonin GroES
MIKPLGDRVVIEAAAKEETTASGIVLPDTAKEKPQEGKIVAIGSGTLKDGERIPLEVKEGDRVLFSKYAGTEVKFEGRELLIMRESDVLAIL